MLVVMLAGWVNEQHRAVNAYLKEENRVLRELHGRSPERLPHMPWSKFLKAHWEGIAAADFFTVEVWTSVGLVRYLVFFVIDLSTRRVEIAGIAPVPNGLWMRQVARNLIDDVNGFLRGKRFLIHDRDPPGPAGIPIPEDIQGTSLVPLMEERNPGSWRDSIYYHYYETDEWECFDLEQDPRELNSVYHEPDDEGVVENLKTELSRLRAYYQDETGDFFVS